MKDNLKTKTGFGGEEIAITIIGIFHLVGAGLLMLSKGLLYQISLDLIPFILIITALVSIKFQSDYQSGFFRFFILAILIGFFAEVLGTNTGLLFGHYAYGNTLGFTIFSTPLLIGINWFLLSYGTGALISPLKIPVWSKWLLATALMVLFDYFMEPVALKHGFWSWTDGNIPVSNYIGWAIVSAIIMFFFYQTKMEKKNPVAGRIWLIQFGFFIIQNII